MGVEFIEALFRVAVAFLCANLARQTGSRSRRSWISHLGGPGAVPSLTAAARDGRAIVRVRIEREAPPEG
jgi:hypothetical protein